MPVSLENIKDPLLKEATLRASKRQGKIHENLTLIRKGHGHEAESEQRLQMYDTRQTVLAKGREWIANAPIEEVASVTEDTQNVDDQQALEFGLERLIGSTNDLLSIEYLEVGILAAQSVGRIIGFGTEFGTGFHVGRGIILTNQHVFSDPTTASSFTFELNVEENKFPPLKQEIVCDFNPERFLLTDEALDFTLVAVECNRTMDVFGWHVLLKEQGKIRIGDPVSIIQHPNGGNKQIVLHNSHFVDLQNGGDVDPFCWYSSDTAKGSSGAPVFNNRWEVVALHHKAVPKTNKNGEILDKKGRPISEDRLERNPEDVAWLANEGVRISRIVKAIEKATFDDPNQTKIRDDLLALWNRRRGHERGLKGS